MTPQFKFPKVFLGTREFICNVIELFMKKPDMPLSQTLSDDLSLENVRSCKYDHDKWSNHARIDLYTLFFTSDFLSWPWR